jgi:hypothetical protein
MQNVLINLGSYLLRRVCQTITWSKALPAVVRPSNDAPTIFAHVQELKLFVLDKLEFRAFVGWKWQVV